MANMLLGISAVGTLKPSSFGIRRQVRKKKLMQSRRALARRSRNQNRKSHAKTQRRQGRTGLENLPRNERSFEMALQREDR
jgi:hypothetical protein